MIDSRLQVLRMVAEHGTITGAAEALHYTPSAVSHQLRQLSADLGVPLTQQKGRGVRLTAPAHTLLRHADVLYAQWERARADMAAQMSEPSGRLGLCGFSTGAASLLPPVAAALRQAYPHLSIQMIEADPKRCVDLLLAGDADLALVVVSQHTPPVSDTRFDQQPMLDDPLDLLVPPEHWLVGRSNVTLFDASLEPWIVGQQSSTYHQLVLTACASAGFNPNIAHYADEWDTGLALVSHGFGVMLVPRLASIANDMPAVRIPLHGEPAPTRRILALTREGGREHPVIARALDAIADTAATLLPDAEPAA
jgi:DNA-binding transcriptional LysR family regulator